MEEIIGKLSERTIFWLSDSDLKPDGLEILLRYKRDPKLIEDEDIIKILQIALSFYKEGYESSEYVFRTVKHKKKPGKKHLPVSPVKEAEEGVKVFFLDLLNKCSKEQKNELRELIDALLRRVEFEINEEK